MMGVYIAIIAAHKHSEYRHDQRIYHRDQGVQGDFDYGITMDHPESKQANKNTN